MTIDEDFDAATAREGLAYQAVETIEQERDALKRARTSAFEASLRAELDILYRTSLDTAKAELADARSERLAMTEARALASTSHEIPPGTLMEEWRVPGRYGYGGVPSATGRRGIVEIITRASVHPASKYFKAAVGRLVIRLLRRDGTPGKDYVSDEWAMKTYWRQSTPPPPTQSGDE